MGLLASPLSQGPLLEAATLFPGRPPAPPVADPFAPHGEPVVPLVRAPVNGPGPAAPDSPPDDAFWVIPLLVIGGLIVGVVVAIGRAAQGPAAVGRVRIVALPPGEAPEKIRRAWIGLELPAADSGQGGSSEVYGVLSNRAGGCPEGYAVDGAEAVRILAANDPDAAAWWHRNAPHVLAGGYQLVFPAEVCERVG